MITRRKDYSKSEPTKDASKIYIVCEGKGSEPDYFGFFEGLSSNLELIVIPPEEGTDPLKLMELAERILLGGTTIRDSVLTNSERELYLCRQKESWVITSLCPMSIQRHGRVTRINARQTAISH